MTAQDGGSARQLRGFDSFEGRTAIVTGAGTGLGRAFALRLDAAVRVTQALGGDTARLAAARARRA